MLFDFNIFRVMVMHEGCLAEFDTPTNLLADRKSLFSTLVANAAVDNSKQS